MYSACRKNKVAYRMKIRSASTNQIKQRGQRHRHQRAERQRNHSRVLGAVRQRAVESRIAEDSRHRSSLPTTPTCAYRGCPRPDPRRESNTVSCVPRNPGSCVA